MIFNKIKKIINSMSVKDIDNDFMIPCIRGNLEVVKIFLNENDLTQEQLNKGLKEACASNSLSVAKYLLTSTDLKKHANIHANNDEGLFVACYYGHVEIVKYLLTSTDLKNCANINSRGGSCFIYACENGHLDVVIFLLSKEMKEQINIHVQEDYAFQSAIQYKRLDILKYLIFNEKIEKTEGIKKYMEENKNKYKSIEQIKKMFEIREFNEKLKKEVNSSDKIKPGFKI